MPARAWRDTAGPRGLEVPGVAAATVVAAVPGVAAATVVAAVAELVASAAAPLGVGLWPSPISLRRLTERPGWLRPAGARGA